MSYAIALEVQFGRQSKRPAAILREAKCFPIFLWMEVNVTRAQIIRKIHDAAKKYKQHFIGKTYMFLFNDTKIEVMFKKASFKHLSGVGSQLNAENFFNHAVKPNGLRPGEIFFSSEHPFDLAVRKIEHLSDLYKLTVNSVKIATDFQTVTFTYTIGITDMELILCLGPDCYDDGRLRSNYLVPYSFRIEEISENRCSNIYDVTYVFSRNSSERKYNTITYGNQNTITNLPEDIKNNIDLQY